MIRFDVHVHPGASRPGVGGTYGGALVVRVRERAVDGAATEAVLLAVADAFGVRRQAVECLRGRRDRRKFLAITGDEEQLEARRLELLAGGAVAKLPGSAR